MADLQQTVGAVIRRERRRRGLTMKSLAKRAALSVVYLGEIERGQKYPSALVLERLAEALGLQTPDVLERVAADLRVEAQTTRAIGVMLPASGPRAAATTRGGQLRQQANAPSMAAPGATVRPMVVPDAYSTAYGGTLVIWETVEDEALRKLECAA